MFKYTLFSIGKTAITIGDIFLFAAIIAASMVISALLRKMLRRRIRKLYNMEHGVASAYERILHYFLIIIGVFTALNAVGVQFSVLFAGGAALLVGIGFGIQNIANNFISGVILLFERPIKVGDYIEVDGILGTVRSISARSSKIVTNDQIVIIVPNSTFLERNVINWSYTELTRLNIPIGVSFDSDLERVTNILLDLAKQHALVAPSPAPDVFCERYADFRIELTLLVHIREHQLHQKIRSDLNFAINRAFKKHNIQIPFPQREIYMKEPKAPNKLHN